MSIQNIPTANNAGTLAGAANVKSAAQPAQAGGTPLVLPAVAPKAAAPVEKVRQIAADMEKFVRDAGRNLQFQVDDGTGQVVVRVVDATSGDVIRQIPSEEFLRLSRSMKSSDADVSLICDECA